MAAGGDVVELCGDADAVAVLADAAFDDIAHAELFGDLPQMNRAPLVDERGVARDHEEPAQLRQRGDDVLADAIGEIVLLGFAAHIGERQHRDRRTIRQRQSGLRHVGRLGWHRGCNCRGQFCDRADEAHALAGYGADQPLLFAIVVDRAPRCVDPAGQSRFRDDTAVPDRVEQIVPRHHALPVADKIKQEVEHLGFQRDERVRPPQFAALGIEHEILEMECHAALGSRSEIKVLSA